MRCPCALFAGLLEKLIATWPLAANFSEGWALTLNEAADHQGGKIQFLFWYWRAARISSRAASSLLSSSLIEAMRVAVSFPSCSRKLSDLGSVRSACWNRHTLQGKRL